MFILALWWLLSFSTQRVPHLYGQVDDDNVFSRYSKVRELTANERNLSRWLCVNRHLKEGGPSKVAVDGCLECQADTEFIIDKFKVVKNIYDLLQSIPK